MSCEKSKTVSFASSIEKNIADCSSGFPVNLICCIVLDQHQVLVFVYIYCDHLIIILKTIIV